MSNDARQRRLLSYRSLLSEEEEQEEGGFRMAHRQINLLHSQCAVAEKLQCLSPTEEVSYTQEASYSGGLLLRRPPSTCVACCMNTNQLHEQP